MCESALVFCVKVANINNHLPTIYGVFICSWQFRNCKGCTAPFAGHTTLKPTKFPEVSLDFFSEDLMFLSVVVVGTLFRRLVPVTKLEESFTQMSPTGGVLD